MMMTDPIYYETYGHVTCDVTCRKWSQIGAGGWLGTNNGCRGGSSPYILGGIAPSAPSSPSPFCPFSETEKYQLHIGVHLKSIISRTANSIMS